MADQETFIELSRSRYSREFCKQYDQYLRAELPHNYKGMKGRKFYFAFRSEADRDKFLAAAQQQFERLGAPTHRTEQ